MIPARAPAATFGRSSIVSKRIDADRLYERAQQPWRRGLAWRYTAAELRIINELAKRREAKG
jgi:hypothetical protein